VAVLGLSDVASLNFVAWVWASIARLDAEATAAVARAEDASPRAAEVVLLGALVTSLIAVLFTFAQAGRAHAPQRGSLAAVAIASMRSRGPRCTRSTCCGTRGCITARPRVGSTSTARRRTTWTSRTSRCRSG
jgi:hypothetical protein